MRLLYILLATLLVPFAVLRLFWKARRMPQYKERIAERFGYVAKQKNVLWVHAVSVGEVIAITPLVKALLKQYPDYTLVMTTMTPTGAERVKANFQEQVVHYYVPYDTPFIVKRFLARVEVKALFLMETELWPTMLRECKRRNIPSVLVNARLSEKSARGYARFGSITASMLNDLTYVLVQADADKERFIRLGLAADKIKTVGSVKYDMPLPSNLDEKVQDLTTKLALPRLVLTAGSTHEGEETIILAAFKKVLAQYPQALLVLVPRHPDRFDLVANLIQEQELTLVRRSSGELATEATQVYLGDSMGELLAFYAVCDVAFVGGSLIVRGGHNILEPALLAKPVVSGESMFNFADITASFLAADALLQVRGEEEFSEVLIDLFADAEKRNRLGQRGLQAVEKNQGALQRHLDYLKNLL